MIKDTPIEDLRTASVEILSKAFFELRQNPDYLNKSYSHSQSYNITFQYNSNV